jgi:competence transcription factor ComK
MWGFGSPYVGKVREYQAMLNPLPDLFFLPALAYRLQESVWISGSSLFHVGRPKFRRPAIR